MMNFLQIFRKNLINEEELLLAYTLDTLWTHWKMEPICECDNKLNNFL